MVTTHHTKDWSNDCGPEGGRGESSVHKGVSGLGERWLEPKTDSTPHQGSLRPTLKESVADGDEDGLMKHRLAESANSPVKSCAGEGHSVGGPLSVYSHHFYSPPQLSHPPAPLRAPLDYSRRRQSESCASPTPDVLGPRPLAFSPSHQPLSPKSVRPLRASSVSPSRRAEDSSPPPVLMQL